MSLKHIIAIIQGGSGGGSTAPDPVFGCTDPEANNYNPSATDDDGSCTYDPPSLYEDESQAYFDHMEGLGATITDTQKVRYDDLVVFLKGIGEYANCLGLFPCYGTTAAHHAVNAVTLTSGTFNGTWIHSSSGCTPNGTNAYFDTGINGKTAMGASAIFQMGYYTRTQVQADQFDLGAAQSGKQLMLLHSNALGALVRIGSDSIAASQGAFTNSVGYTIGRRLTNTDLTVWKGGTEITTTATSNAQDLPNVNIYAGAYNNNGTAAGFSTRQFCWMDLIGSALSDGQINELNILVEGIQESFNRGVQ
jgi:hypothetical protein